MQKSSGTISILSNDLFILICSVTHAVKCKLYFTYYDTCYSLTGNMTQYVNIIVGLIANFATFLRKFTNVFLLKFLDVLMFLLFLMSERLLHHNSLTAHSSAVVCCS